MSRRSGRLAGLAGALLVAIAAAAAAAAPPAVSIVRSGGGFVLMRGGRPLFIRGAGVPPGAPLAMLDSVEAHGGNSIRTWGVEPDSRAILDRAQRLGLTVCFGLWLQHESPQFSFRHPDQFRAELDEVERAVLAFRDHPAVLMWGVGNEVEGFDPAAQDDPAVWKRIQVVAALVKRLDPTRPTLTTLAEIGGGKVGCLNRYCPAIDIVGVNSYRGLPSLPRRYRAAGGRKPYLVTEFGPPGTWEVDRTPWGAPIEPTSTEKAESYRAGAAAAMGDHPGLCLGACAFLWGAKQELTATWYGMFLKDGSRLAAVDAMEELWRGRPASAPCPRIGSIRWRGPARVPPGAPLSAALSAEAAPGCGPIAVVWSVRSDTTELNLGGAAEAERPELPGVVAAAGPASASLRAPAAPGPYRLFAVVKDGRGGAATANLPFLVEAPPGR